MSALRAVCAVGFGILGSRCDRREHSLSKMVEFVPQVSALIGGSLQTSHCPYSFELDFYEHLFWDSVDGAVKIIHVLDQCHLFSEINV